MIRLARDFRLIPVVLVATVCLLALKVSGLLFEGGYTLGERIRGHAQPGMTITDAKSVPDYPKIVVEDNKRPVAANKRSWAQQMFNFNDGNGDITGSVGSEPAPANGPPLKVSEKPPGPPTIEAGGTSFTISAGQNASPGERKILESLQERRKELDARSRNLDMRESLIKAAEKRLEAKIAELRDMEAKVKAAMGMRDKQEEERFKSVISMYENMKAKDAARIFDKLEPAVLLQVTSALNPRKMSEILANMSPDTAEKLTVELAKRANGAQGMAANQLPKIEGKPTQ